MNNVDVSVNVFQLLPMALVAPKHHFKEKEVKQEYWLSLLALTVLATATQEALYRSAIICLRPWRQLRLQTPSFHRHRLQICWFAELREGMGCVRREGEPLMERRMKQARRRRKKTAFSHRSHRQFHPC